MQTESDVAYFEPQKKPAELKIRYPAKLREEMNEIVEIWDELEQRTSGKRVSLNDVIVRLLEVGVAGVWAEYDGRPETTVGRKALIERLAKIYVADSKPSKR